MTPDGQEQLMLGGGEAGSARLLRAPPLEPTQTSPQREQPRVGLIGKGHPPSLEGQLRGDRGATLSANDFA